jgi:hypothetical protein
MIGVLFEALTGPVRHEHRHTTGAAVHERGVHGLAKIVFSGHVVDCIVHEHCVERAAKADGAHVPLSVHAFRVELTGHGQHLARQIDKCEAEAGLHVGGVVAAATPELENLSCGNRAGP